MESPNENLRVRSLPPVRYASPHYERLRFDVMPLNAVSGRCTSGRLTCRELFDTQVVGAAVHFRSAPQTHLVANALKLGDIVGPTIGVELSLATRPSILAEVA
jgi:hypothetical protein